MRNKKDAYKTYRQELKDEQRFQRFIDDLDQIMQDTVDCNTDDHGNILPSGISEDEIYGMVMAIDEYHLLGEERVRNTIHLFLTNFPTRISILRVFGLM